MTYIIEIIRDGTRVATYDIKAEEVHDTAAMWALVKWMQHTLLGGVGKAGGT